jgi:hypothetical protein
MRMIFQKQLHVIPNGTIQVKLFTISIVLILFSVSAHAHDFTATYNGKTIYYTIISASPPYKAAVDYSGNVNSRYTGDVVIPSSVYYSAKTYSVTSIGEIAFADCSSLTSVTIPNSVTTIGSVAFSYCSSITEITNLNPIPVSISASVFEGRNIACFLKVPAGSMSLYQVAPVWGDFSIKEGYILSINVNNPFYGHAHAATENGIYELNETATLTAVANQDYVFENWTSNGTVVSTANPYSFTVTGDISLIANFKETVVGLTETKRSNNGVSIYPNPVQTDLFIQSELPIEKVEIYDM